MSKQREPRPEPQPGESSVGGDIIQVDASASVVAAGAGAIAVQADGDVTISAAELAYNVAGLPNPFLGLRPFTYDDRHSFAGREAIVAEALRRLTTPGEQRVLLFVTGASGSGKSSFAQAGLLPALQDFYAERGLKARHAVVRPGRLPLASLADGLARLGLGQVAAFAAAYPFMVGVPNTPPAEHAVGLLVIDQFEELFAQECDATQRNLLFAILAGLPPFARLRMHLLATMRADFLPELFAQQPLYELAKQGIDLRAMSVDELKSAIVRPLQHAHPQGEKRFEPALLERLAEDAAEDAAYLPLLQVTLEDLWRRGALRLAAYDSLTEALGRRAEEIYGLLDYDSTRSTPRPAAEQATIMAILLELVDVSLDDNARRDVRRRRGAAQLEAGDMLRARLIDELAAARLLSKSLEPARRLDGESLVRPLGHGEQGEQGEVVDIIHETLLRSWERLRRAVAEQRELLQTRARFEQALDEWLECGRDSGYLLDGIRLAEAEALNSRGDVALRTEHARELLQASVEAREAERQRELEQARRLAMAEQQAREEAERRAEAEQQARRRLRSGALALGVVALLAFSTAVAALLFWRASARNARIATARSLIAEAQASAALHPLAALRLAAEGLAWLPADASTEQAAIMRDAILLASDGRVALVAVDAEAIDPLRGGELLLLRRRDGEQQRRELRSGLDGRPVSDALDGADPERLIVGRSAPVYALRGDDGFELRALADNRLLAGLGGRQSKLEIDDDAGAIKLSFEQQMSFDDTRASFRLEIPAGGELFLSFDGRVALLKHERPDSGDRPDELRCAADAFQPRPLGYDEDQPPGARPAQAPRFTVAAATISADGRLIAVRYQPHGQRDSRERVTTLYDGRSCRKIAELGQLRRLRFSPAGSLVSIERAQHSQLVHAADQRELASIAGDVDKFIFSPDEDTYIVDYNGGPGEIRRASDQGLLVPLRDHVDGVDFGPQGSFVVRFSNSPSQFFARADSAPLELPGRADAVRFSADEAAAAIRFADGQTDLYDLRGGTMPWPLGFAIDKLAFGPDNSRLTVLYDDRRAYLVDLPLLHRLATLNDGAPLAQLLCDVTEGSPLWTDADAQLLAEALGNTAPRACQG